MSCDVLDLLLLTSPWQLVVSLVGRPTFMETLLRARLKVLLPRPMPARICPRTIDTVYLLLFVREDNKKID